MSSEQNKTTMRRLLEEVWGKGNVNLLREFFSKDVCDNMPMPGQPCGLEGQEYAVRGIVTGVSNIKMTVDDLIARDDRVVDRWTFTGTHTGNMMGMPATGKKFTITGSDEARFEGGKIVELWHVEDNMGMMQQLGVAPASPQQPQSYGRQTTTGSRPGGSSYGTRLSDTEKEERLRDAYTRLLDRGDVDAAREFVTDDYVGHFANFPPVYGPDGLKQYLQIYTTGLSNRRTEIDDIVIEGEKVACRLTFYGKNTGNMMGMPPTNRSATTHAFHFFRYAGDKVVEQFANNDDLGLLQQLGVVPVAAGMPAPEPC